jgi:hypothetical protein
MSNLYSDNQHASGQPSQAEALPCLKCHYNLTGLSPTSICPECQFPIQDTIAAFRFGGFQSARTKLLAQYGLITFVLSMTAFIISAVGLSVMSTFTFVLVNYYLMRIPEVLSSCLLPLSLIWLTRTWTSPQELQRSTFKLKTLVSNPAWRCFAWLTLVLSLMNCIAYFEMVYFNLNGQPSKLSTLIPWGWPLMLLIWLSSILTGVAVFLTICATSRLATATKRLSLGRILKYSSWPPLALMLVELGYFALSSRSLQEVFAPGFQWVRLALYLIFLLIPAICASMLFLHIRRVPAR